MTLKTLLAVAALVVGPAVMATACFDRLTVSQTQDQNHHNDTVPSPSTSPSPSASPVASGDNKVVSMPGFCYGFGTIPAGGVEPNHGQCELPSGYPGPIAVTFSPKNAAGIDVPNPSNNIVVSANGVRLALGESKAVDGAVVTQSASVPFNVEVGRGAASAAISLTAVYTHVDGNVFTGEKLATIK